MCHDFEAPHVSSLKNLGSLAIVSEFMPNGNLRTYAKELVNRGRFVVAVYLPLPLNPRHLSHAHAVSNISYIPVGDLFRLDWLFLNLALGVARGIAHLHSLKVRSSVRSD